MAGSVNKAISIGNLGADPEIVAPRTAGRVANLRLATSESWKDKTSGERKEKTEWHCVVIFNENRAGSLSNISTRVKVFIDGALQTRKMAGSIGPGPLLDRIGRCKVFAAS